MTQTLSTRPFLLLATSATALAGGVFAPASASGAAVPSPGPATAVYRCGNLYSQTPCPGAAPLQIDDARTDEQQRQREDVTAREKRLAAVLESERHQRDRSPTPAPVSNRPAACPARAPSGANSYAAPRHGTSACTTPRRSPPKPATAKASGAWTAVAPASAH